MSILTSKKLVPPVAYLARAQPNRFLFATCYSTSYPFPVISQFPYRIELQVKLGFMGLSEKPELALGDFDAELVYGFSKLFQSEVQVLRNLKSRRTGQTAINK